MAYNPEEELVEQQKQVEERIKRMYQEVEREKPSISNLKNNMIETLGKLVKIEDLKKEVE